ncbi:MAG: putative entry exclusion protein TrbK-alt [Acidiphilium sp.]
MNVKFLVAISFVVIDLSGMSAPAWASAPTIDQLVANPKMLTAELDRCKHLGMAANDDVRCHTAWQAENKQFFGHAPTYTQKPVHLFKNTPNKFVPSEHEHSISPPTAGAPHG